ncbi:patatin-like phospholipase family protein [Portibacter lacus]|uniref:PNPLA domain-containing protein n=1 Tax=Portibacter lacus TaxID=1099794 RepID=A0AA37SK57_9BACT|nr:patatin-like phospholipase family protein [Portibacter lacus]GLR15505.1 hypothetical protein GCM10007940_01200 [Portibacter lacus]
MKKLPKKPFESIALCMSGGGYRAASFHLGAMSYLNRVDLLENVKAISTVSGGTITGVVYALFKERGETFDQIYDRLIYQLRNRDLIKEGIAKLKLDGEWQNKTKRRNLINAFSEIYDEHFTEGATFSEFTEDGKSHLKLVVFNATEFNHGINFRFQNRGALGNNYVKVPKAIQGEIKLADIIAASSCFPGGFEPIGFPGDFLHAASNGLEELKSEKYLEDVGLMDGGIYDNQGIDAIQLSEVRNSEKHDLIIISDVSSPDMSGFEFYKDGKMEGLRTKNVKSVIQSIRRITTGVLLTLSVLIIGAIIIAWMAGFQNNIGTGIGIALLSVGIVLLAGFLIGRAFVKGLGRKIGNFIKKQVPEFYYQHLSALNLTDYKVGDYEPLIMDRIKSLLMLLQDVFLKQIRRLNYGKIYNSVDYEHRRISNLSKELTEDNFNNRTKRFQSLPNCPEHMKKPYPDLLGKELASTISEAAGFGTNLWFTEDDELNRMLDKLIISGQFNMCFNLIVYILELQQDEDYKEYSPLIKAEVETLLQNLLNDWDLFVANPRFLIN